MLDTCASVVRERDRDAEREIGPVSASTGVSHGHLLWGYFAATLRFSSSSIRARMTGQVPVHAVDHAAPSSRVSVSARRCAPG